jgi:hypothetical protein
MMGPGGALRVTRPAPPSLPAPAQPQTRCPAGRPGAPGLTRASVHGESGELLHLAIAHGHGADPLHRHRHNRRPGAQQGGPKRRVSPGPAGTGRMESCRTWPSPTATGRIHGTATGTATYQVPSRAARSGGSHQGQRPRGGWGTAALGHRPRPRPRGGSTAPPPAQPQTRCPAGRPGAAGFTRASRETRRTGTCPTWSSPTATGRIHGTATGTATEQVPSRAARSAWPHLGQRARGGWRAAAPGHRTWSSPTPTAMEWSQPPPKKARRRQWQSCFP